MDLEKQLVIHGPDKFELIDEKVQDCIITLSLF